MHTKVIDVKSFVATLRQKVRKQTQELIENHRIKPTLAVVLAGNDPASEVYVAQKIKACRYCKMNSVEYRLSENVSEAKLLKLIDELNQDEEVNGILVQLPLPKQIDENRIINAIDSKKDVDGFSFENVGRLHSQQNQFVPCTPLGTIMMLEHHLGNLSGKSAVVIGRSRIVGRPMAELLLQKNCTVTTAHSRTPTQRMNALTQNADIIIAAVGIARFLKAENIAKGAVVIDVGINRITDEHGNSKLVGDVDFVPALKVVSAITPVPGGVGLLTVSCLLLNTLKATYLQHNIQFDEATFQR